MKPINERIVVFSLTTALLTGAGATLAYAGHKGHHGCDREGGFGPAAAVQLLDNLTTEQKAQLEQIRNEARDTSRELREAMLDTRAELRTAIAENAGLETVRSLAEKRGDQKTEMIVLRAQTRDKINGVLTEEQRQQLAEMRASRKDGPHHHHGMRDF
jgi:Spy/CpxP family protein refolding chaperone